MESLKILAREARIELTPKALEASILPLNYSPSLVSLVELIILSPFQFQGLYDTFSKRIGLKNKVNKRR